MPNPSNRRPLGGTPLFVALLLASLIPAPSALAGPEGAAAEIAEPRDERADRATASDPEDREGAADAGAEPRDADLFDRVRVVGRTEDAERIPGSVAVLDETVLERQDHTDVHRVLSQVPGVYFQEEDGFGLRPNIGIRGSGLERSAKITALEDGVLIAPAPYTAPSAYYFPTMGRMQTVEVRKGSSSIQHGPYTNGGVLNLLSSSIPSELGGRVDIGVGPRDAVRARAKVGSSRSRFGWLVETFQDRTTGFKSLDGGGDTGYVLNDYLAKVRINNRPDARHLHLFELKLGKTEQDGDETYLGLTREDFGRDPRRRYAASQNDRILTDHEQIQGRYLFRPNERFDLTATLYNNDFFRNWYKLERVNGASVSSVLADPANNAPELAILRGEVTSADDALTLRNNRRDYYSRGLDVRLGITPGGRDSHHDLEVGVRYHRDEEDRFQDEDGYRMNAGGSLTLTSNDDSVLQANRVSDADAVAAYVYDTMRYARWTVSAGLRFESIDYSRTDFADVGRTSLSRPPLTNRVEEWIPGAGASFRINDRSSVFAGIHRGFTPPGPGGDARAEKSTNYELGYRHRAGGLSSQVVTFFNDYENLIGFCTVFSACEAGDIGQAFDGGEARTWGAELGLTHDGFGFSNGRVTVPVSVAYTYTRTEFRSSFDSDLWGDVFAGDEFPYVPTHQAAVGVGLRGNGWRTFSNVIYLGTTRTDPGQGPIERDASTDDRWVVDLSAGYDLRPGLELYLQIRNFTDEVYVAARRPAGARPGAPRTVLAGVDWRF